MFGLDSICWGAGRLAVGGSRDLDSLSARGFVEFATAWQASGRQIGMGCSVGADALALRGMVHPRLVDVFAVCSPCGSGAWAGTALADVLAAGRRGANVRWYAGGAPDLPLAVRLAARSRALGNHAPAGCLVALTSPTSRGALQLARTVAARRPPVVAIACGFSWYMLPPLASGGHWRRLGLLGTFTTARWVGVGG